MLVAAGEVTLRPESWKTLENCSNYGVVARPLYQESVQGFVRLRRYLKVMVVAQE